jgi:glucose/arabinose dehydrogenase
MHRLISPFAWLLVLAGCASAPKLTPWRADPLMAGLPPVCTTGAPAPEPAAAAAILPGGLAFVRSEGRDVVLVAARGCVMTVDVGTGASEPLPTRGDSIAPTMVDATSDGVAFSSTLSGSVRAINATGAVTFNMSGLREPQGLRLMPGGAVIVAEHGAGRILRIGPTEESRPGLIADGLEGPVGLVIADATKGYVTEYRAGRVTMFRLDRFEKSTVVSGLKQPEGIALLADGRLAVAEVGNRRLIAADPATGKITVMTDPLPLGLPPPAGQKEPYTVTDVAVGPDGALYVSADVDRTVLKVTPRPGPPK